MKPQLARATIDAFLLPPSLGPINEEYQQLQTQERAKAWCVPLFCTSPSHNLRPRPTKSCLQTLITLWYTPSFVEEQYEGP